MKTYYEVKPEFDQVKFWISIPDNRYKIGFRREVIHLVAFEIIDKRIYDLIRKQYPFASADMFEERNLQKFETYWFFGVMFSIHSEHYDFEHLVERKRHSLLISEFREVYRKYCYQRKSKYLTDFEIENILVNLSNETLKECISYYSSLIS